MSCLKQKLLKKSTTWTKRTQRR